MPAHKFDIDTFKQGVLSQKIAHLEDRLDAFKTYPEQFTYDVRDYSYDRIILSGLKDLYKTMYGEE